VIEEETEDKEREGERDEREGERRKDIKNE
jgi:hypothetical protein